MELLFKKETPDFSPVIIILLDLPLMIYFLTVSQDVTRGSLATYTLPALLVPAARRWKLVAEVQLRFADYRVTVFFYLKLHRNVRGFVCVNRCHVNYTLLVEGGV